MWENELRGDKGVQVEPLVPRVVDVGSLDEEWVSLFFHQSWQAVCCLLYFSCINWRVVAAIIIMTQ